MAPVFPDKKNYRILLTGGSGFLGSSIVRELLDESSPLPVRELVVYDLKPFADTSDQKVKFIRGDVRDRELLQQSCAGIDLVIHSAAIVDWGTLPEQEIFAVNVEGTRNVLEASVSNGVKAMVYTSSLDVLHDGSPLVDVDETHPYPERHSTSYCVSKFRAEKIVTGANSGEFRTCSLRPADIYGEGDPYHIGSLIRMARGGFYIRLGNGRSMCQHVYVGNVAQAHILAANALLNGSVPVSGQSYFITDAEATNFFSFFDRIVEGSGYRIWPANLWLPRRIAYGIGTVSEFIAFFWRPIKRYSPKMSRFAVTYTCTDYTFSSDKARRELGFIPKYSNREAFERTVTYYKNM